mmetsp:Transcript_16479/g.39456  ORF Transcript_16479/g.39456 Transcript_16479/m.39456 type:complete len:101 (+) Transcript_16479:1904-2206(+)
MAEGNNDVAIDGDNEGELDGDVDILSEGAMDGSRDNATVGVVVGHHVVGREEGLRVGEEVFGAIIGDVDGAGTVDTGDGIELGTMVSEIDTGNEGIESTP